jgi:Cu+-exporting ATPase
LWNSETFNKAKEEKAVTHTAMVSKYFTYAVLMIAFGTLIFWYLVDATVMWNAFTAVLIVACPCALALSMPYALGNSMRIFGRNKFYLKNAEVVSHLSEIDQLVFDKTGTITQSDAAEIEFVGEYLTDAYKVYIKSIAFQSTHPLSKRITELYDNQPIIQPSYIKEVEGKGIYGKVDGFGIKIGSLRFLNPEFEQSEEVNHLESRVYVNFQGRTLGYFKIQNQYRPELNKVVVDLQKKYEISVLTGDNQAELGRLRAIFGEKADLLFQQTPEDKLRYIENEQKKHKKVSMIGDGLNDAGALKQSDVGIALTEDTSAFTPACDVILDAEKFEKLPIFLKFSKIAVKVVKMSLVLSLLYNLFGLSFAVSGTLSPVLAAILMPLSSVTVVGFIVLMTNWQAKKLGLL